ncbi:MAG: RcpC/CpaB family pilus assembly protein [Lachnospiraceae bacterium]|nr:RcpC/CpaB family pilus assembly protein [Lachnospiraceae bacterium]MCM1239016.1 RcpC/CpaB family pilus assembly protein [Lachnospiraceae bacterium]
MKLNNRLIFGLLSLLLAAVIAFVALPTIARQTNGKTQIVRITKPVLKGEQITADNTECVEVGSYNLPLNIARSLDDVKGLYAAADLAQGDYILTSKISIVPISSDAALNSIPSGKVAISLTVKTLASGLSDKLQPGDIIRIYHFLDTAEDVPELHFVKVLSVTDAGGMNVDNAKEPLADEEKQQSATITVLASPEQARLITAMENEGVAHVALICRNNEKLAEDLLAEQDLILQEIYFPETLTDEDADGEQAADGQENTTAEKDGAAGQDSAHGESGDNSHVPAENENKPGRGESHGESN